MRSNLTDGAEKYFQSTIMRLLGNRLLVFDYKDLEILQSLHDGKSIVAQFHQPRPDLFVLINSNPVYCNDEIIGAVVSETDVTNQVALNENYLICHMKCTV